MSRVASSARRALQTAWQDCRRRIARISASACLDQIQIGNKQKRAAEILVESVRTIRSKLRDHREEGNGVLNLDRVHAVFRESVS